MSGVVNSRVRVLLLEDGQEQAERLRGLLKGEDMELVVVSGTIEEGLHEARNWTPDVILIARPRGSLPEAVKQIDTAYGDTPVVAMLTAEQATRFARETGRGLQRTSHEDHRVDGRRQGRGSVLDDRPAHGVPEQRELLALRAEVQHLDQVDDDVGHASATRSSP